MMSLDLERELNELASQARQYADATRVLRTVGRRRRQRLALGGAAAAVVLAAAAAIVDLRPPTTTTDPRVSAGAAQVSSPMLPSVVDPPEGAVIELPTDRGVGRAGLVYQPTVGGPAYLVTEDGTQYLVPFTPLTGTAYIELYQNLPASLSPDGRWLAIAGRSRTTLRDLTSSAVVSLPSYANVLAWSSDGQWLVYTAGGTFLLHLESAQTWPLPDAAAGPTIYAPMPGGHVVGVVIDPAVPLTRIMQFDPVHGSDTQSIKIDTNGLLQAGERLSWQFELPPDDAFGGCGGAALRLSSVNGGRLLLGVFDQPQPLACDDILPAEPVGYAVLDATSGRVTSVLRLPVGAGAPLWYGGDVVYPSQASPSDRVDFILTDAKGGSLGRLTSLPPAAAFVLPGQVVVATGPAVTAS